MSTDIGRVQDATCADIGMEVYVGLRQVVLFIAAPAREEVRKVRFTLTEAEKLRELLATAIAFIS